MMQSRGFHPLLLLLWTIVGAVLRFMNLTAKPPWTDEFATLVFSLGNSFEGVPLDQAISITTLLEPLRVNGQVNIANVLQHLFTEDVHPPLYFILSHLWLQLFPTNDGLISLWAARSLPALLGVASIPAMYGLGWLALRSPWVSHLAAALMAVSPFGVYLAQEARHYTLGILWVIGSLACLTAAVQAIQSRHNLSFWVVLAWIVTNTLGVATHFFMLITLAAEAIALLSVGIVQNGRQFNLWLQIPWRRIYLAVLGTALGCSVWIPLWLTIRSREVTQWIQDDSYDLLALISPIFQALAAWITMLVLLPVEAASLPVVIGSGLLMTIFVVWVVPILWRGLQARWRNTQTRLIAQAIASFVLGAIAIFFFITYGLGADLTRGARYNFVYFPGVILLFALSLSVCWQRQTPWDSSPPQPATSTTWTVQLRQWTKRYGKRAVVLVWIVGLLSGLTVVNNLGYRKYYRPDQFVPLVAQTAENPVLVATTQSTLVQIGEMMGLGWQIRFGPDVYPVEPQFLLAHEQSVPCENDCQATETLAKTLNNQPQPLDVWLVNFQAPETLDTEGCLPVPDASQAIYGYENELYRCNGLEAT